MRRILALVVILITIGPARPIAALPCWQPPARSPVTDPFREPRCRWCVGNRGIEYGTPRGALVRSVATGRVSYSGVIAGTGYVVVRLASGLRVTYGNLGERPYRTGDLVARGAVVGTTSGRLHFGVRDGDSYLDPTPYLGRLVDRPRLVPTDGSRAVDLRLRQR